MYWFVERIFKYQNCICPQSLSSFWLSYRELRTRIHTMNVINVLLIHTCEHDHHVPFHSFQTYLKYFLAHNIICTQNLFIFIRFLVALSRYVYDFKFLRLNCLFDEFKLFVDMSNCFIENEFNTFGQFSNMSLSFNELSNIFIRKK